MLTAKCLNQAIKQIYDIQLFVIVSLHFWYKTYSRGTKICKTLFFILNATRNIFHFFKGESL